jgi:RHS repeat-associated protein
MWGSACSQPDQNGDGNADLLANCLEVHLNTGQGFQTEPVAWTVPAGSAFRLWVDGETRRDLSDITGDGLPDVLLAGDTGDWVVLFNLGNHFEDLVPSDQLTCTCTPLPPPFGGTYCGPPCGYLGTAARTWSGLTGPIRETDSGKRVKSRIDLVDIDGDGLLDRVDANSNPWQVQRAQNPLDPLNPALDPVRPNLLVAMDNGLGGTTDVTYAPSTSFVSDETGVPNDGGDGISDLPFVTWVVTGIRKSDGRCTPPPTADPFDPLGNTCVGTGHEQNATFVYQDGRFDPAAREFRGFRVVYREDMDGNATRTTFAQDEVAKGKVLEVQTYAGSGTTATAVRAEYNWWEATLFPGTQAGRTQLWLGATDRLTFDLGASVHFLETVNEPPDPYGNITATATQGLWGANRVDTVIDYAAPTSGSKVTNKPAHTQVWEGSTTLSEQWFFYDGLPYGQVAQGLVTRVESWVNDPLNPSSPNLPPGSAPCTAAPAQSCVAVTNTYDPYGNLTAVTDARGETSTTTYDAEQLYPVTECNAANECTETEMDYRWGRPKKVTDPGGASVEYSYDEAGRLELVARPGDPLTWAGASERYTYDFGAPGAGSNPAELSSIAVERKEPNYAAAGYYLPVRSYVDALGRPHHSEILRVVNGASQPQTIVTDHVEYDAGSRVAKRYTPYLASAGTPDNGATVFDYHLNGFDGDGNGVPDYVDPLGRIYTVTHPDGTSRRTHYEGHFATTYDEENHQTVTGVDIYGRVGSRKSYDGATPYAWTTTTYDGLGRVLRVRQNGDDNTRITHTYNALGQKVRTVDPDSGTWTYRYDAVGNLIVQDDPKAGQHLQFCYDGTNRVTRKCPMPGDYAGPADSIQGLCAYSCVAEEVQYTYGRTGDLDFENAAHPWGVGRLTKVVDESGETHFQYNQRGLVIGEKKIVLGVEAVTKTQYDAADRVQTITYPDGEQVTTGYDASGQPITLTGPANYVDGATYDLFGRLIELRHSNGVVDRRDYYGQVGGHRLAALGSEKAGTNPYLDLSYEVYTARGQLRKIVDYADPLGARSNSIDLLQYDVLGRLVAVQSPNSAVAASYEYDALGNITAKNEFDPAIQGALQRVFLYGNPARPHQVTAVCANGGCTGIGHDLNGNRTGKEGQTYGCDKEDRVNEILAGNDTVELRYDYTGRRVVETRNPGGGELTTRFFSPLLEVTGDGGLIKHYFFAGLRVASRREEPGQWQFAAAALAAAPIQFASIPLTHPALVVLLRRDAQVWLVSTATLAGLVLLLAPWRRKRVVGLRVRHGHVVGITILFSASTLPWPLLIRPAPAAAQEATTTTSTTESTLVTATASAPEAPTDPVALGLPATATEDVAARSEYTKTLRLATGVSATVSDGTPQHYRDEAGRWRNIEVIDEPDGTAGRRYRRLPYDVRVGRQGIVMGDRAGGWGLRFQWPEAPLCANHTCTMRVNGVDFQFRIGRPGVSITSAAVASSRGRQVYRLPVELLGDMPPFSAQAGALVNDRWQLSAPVLVGANGAQYPATWQIDTTPSLQFAIVVDDRTLPAEAYPYFIDPLSGPNISFAADGALALPAGKCDGASSWTNPTYVRYSDDQRATSDPGVNNYTKCLRASAFGFWLPPSDQINGIQVEVERGKSGSGATYIDQAVSLVDDAATVRSENKAISSPGWPATEAYQSYGGSADLWGDAGFWTPARINDADFGVALSAYKSASGTPNARIDHIRITVYHQLPAGYTCFQTGVCCTDDTGTDCEDNPHFCDADADCTTGSWDTCADGGMDDAFMRGQDTVWPPAFDSCSSATYEKTLYTRARLASGTYTVEEALLQWDTAAAIPDDATVTDGFVRFYSADVIVNDGRNFVCETYDHGGVCDASDYATTPGNGFIDAPLSGMVSGGIHDLPVTASGVNKTGYTRVRCGISGGTPAGNNFHEFAAWENVGGLVPGVMLCVKWNAATPTPIAPTPTATPTATPTQTATATATPTGSEGGGGAGTVNTLWHYHVDHLGSTQVITDALGNALEHIRYTAYGEIRGRWGSADPDMRYEFTGYHTEPASGLQYAGARFYDPMLASFLTHDPMRQFPNPYAYLGGDPINDTDVDGEIPALVVAFLIGFAVGFTATALQAGLNGASFGQALQAGLISGVVGGVSGVGFGIVGGAVAASGSLTLRVAYNVVLTGLAGYGTYQGFSTGNYVLGAVAAVGVAFGVKGTIDAARALMARPATTVKTDQAPQPKPNPGPPATREKGHEFLHDLEKVDVRINEGLRESVKEGIIEPFEARSYVYGEADFVVYRSGVAIPTSRAQLAEGLQRAGFKVTPNVRTSESGLTFENEFGTRFRVMEGGGKNIARLVTTLRGGNVVLPDGSTIPPHLTPAEIRDLTHFPLKP